MDYKSFRVIYLDSKEIKRNDIIWGLVGLGIDVKRSTVIVDINYPDENQIVQIWEDIKTFDVVMTQNFSVNVAAACHLAKIRYISWIYDSPQVSLYTDFAFFEENYVFCFDKVQVERLKQRGLKHVFYQPLAANVDYINTLKTSRPSIAACNTDLSFIGQLYNTVPLNQFMQMASEQEIADFKSDVSKYFCNWHPETNLYANDNELAAKLAKYTTQSDYSYYRIEPSFVLKTLIYSIYLAREERLSVLTEAASICNASLHTIERDIPLASTIEDLKVYSPVKGEQLYHAYSKAKLNLNISLHSIENAAPQRVFDITVVGGAVISDYRDAIAELFIPDKEIILFESSEEFKDKVKYYLNHETQLETIARAGRKKTISEYNYIVSLKKMFNLAI